MFEPNGKTNRNRGVRFAAVSVLMVGVLLPGVAGAMTQQAQQNVPEIAAMAPVVPAATQATSAPIPRTQAPPVAAESEGPQTLHLLVGRSLVITSPSKIKRVSLADPSIAEAIVVSPYQVLVNGKAPGGVSLMLWDESDQSQAFEVSVDIDILSLTEKIHEVFPNEQVQIETSKDSVILSGHASSAAVADKILEVVKSATPKVTSLIATPVVQPGEILLEVKFAEVDRSAVSQFGVNILSLPGGKNIGSISTQEFGPPSVPTRTTSTSSSTTTTSSSLGG